MVFNFVKDAQNWVNEKVDDLLGIEAQLGQTDDPKLLVNGEPDTIAETAAHLSKLGAAFGETARGFSEIDVQHWTGDAADAFRAKFQDSPKQWVAAADAFELAGDAFVAYGGVVKWAQGQAKQAIDLFEHARQTSQQAADRYNQQAAQATEPLPPFSDPGAADRAKAQDMLSAARRQRDSAAEQAQRAIEAATAKAPAEPSAMERFLDDVTDQSVEFGDGVVHMVGGAFEAVEGVVKFARSLNPMDSYNVTHPASYIEGLSNTATGLLHSVAHPVDLVKGLVGTGWGSDPAEALGKLLPNLALGVVTDGAGTAAETAESVAAKAAESAAERGATTAAESAATKATAEAAESTGTDAAGMASHHQYPSWESRTPPEPPVQHYEPQPRSMPEDFEELQPSVFESGGWDRAVDSGPAEIGERSPENIDPHVFDSALAQQDAASAKIDALPKVGGDAPSATQVQSAAVQAPPVSAVPRPPVETHVFDSVSGKLEIEPDIAKAEELGKITVRRNTKWTDEAKRLQQNADREQGPLDHRSREAYEHGTQAAPEGAHLPEDMPATTVWRRTMEKLFRLDSRKPDEIFGDGFRVPEEKVGSGTDLANQVNKNQGDYVSTTRNTELHDQFRPPDDPNIAEVRYIYHLDPPGGVDVLLSAPEGVVRSVDQEAEVAFLGGVDRSYISGAEEVRWNPEAMNWERTGKFVDNPHYGVR
ncbi:putative T7SS-secreted protein [Kutzneria sp. CA-103260]|uniref:putative T7SS-secreted protein n=1 Tax=Kutzneria sp. CA-103260 TaxID=2802641 RepID=UPI001BADF4DD|nr:hypothetical protein [Kutzneria sp. CA-103260]QUQ70353.1 hypothetical protein JJ691_81290 [Kutzneria sp. CA-103260]